MRYDPDYDVKIEARWWHLMSYALTNKKLCVKLEKHLDGISEVLLVRIFPNDRKPVCLFSEFDLHHEPSLYHKTKKFVDDYKNLN